MIYIIKAEIRDENGVEYLSTSSYGKTNGTSYIMTQMEIKEILDAAYKESIMLNKALWKYCPDLVSYAEHESNGDITSIELVSGIQKKVTVTMMDSTTAVYSYTDKVFRYDEKTNSLISEYGGILNEEIYPHFMME